MDVAMLIVDIAATILATEALLEKFGADAFKAGKATEIVALDRIVVGTPEEDEQKVEVWKVDDPLWGMTMRATDCLNAGRVPSAHPCVQRSPYDVQEGNGSRVAMEMEF